MADSSPILLRLVACACLSAAVIVGPASSQKEKPAGASRKVSAALQGQIDNAIDLGVESLLGRQALDGSWPQQAATYGPGMTGLALYALLKSGVSAENASLERGFDFLKRGEHQKTYTRSTMLLALATRGDKRDKRLMEELVEELDRSQDALGWGYPSSPADLSNTQFAATALRAADAHGISVPKKIWQRLIKSTLGCLAPEKAAASSGTPPRPFLYRPGHEHATGSMTAAGVAVLSMCAEHSRVVTAPHARAMKRGLAWLGETFSTEHNPAPTMERGFSDVQYYYLYGIERVGSLQGIEMLGSYPWYQLGAEKLVELQQDDGSWGSSSDTAFALLFLARATGSFGPSSGSLGTSSRWSFGGDSPASDLSLRASGRRSLTIWVSSFGERVREAYADEDKGLVPVTRVEYWLVVPRQEDRLLEALEVEDPAEGLRKRFAVKSKLLGPRSCEVYARVFTKDREKPYQSKRLKVRIGISERASWVEYATDHERNLLLEAGAKSPVEVTASTERPNAGEAAINVLDGLIGVGWKPLSEDKAVWIRIEPSRPLKCNTLLLSHAQLRGTLLNRLEVILNGDEDEAITASMVQDPREKTIISLPPKTRLRSLELRFLDPIPHGCAGLGEIELQRR